MDWKEIERKLAGDPSTFTNETFTPEEWAAMTERINERKSRAVTLEAIDEWINRTVMRFLSPAQNPYVVLKTEALTVIL